MSFGRLFLLAFCMIAAFLAYGVGAELFIIWYGGNEPPVPWQSVAWLCAQLGVDVTALGLALRTALSRRQRSSSTATG